MMSKKVSSKKMKKLMASICIHGSDYNGDIGWLKWVSVRGDTSTMCKSIHLGELDSQELFSNLLEAQKVLNLPKKEYKICRY